MTPVRAAVAAVWMYEGLWCKVLGMDADHRSIVAGVPGLPTSRVTAALIGLGAVETAVGAWVITGAQARLAAWVQTGLLVAVNAGGLAFAGDRIARPGRMLAQNAVLLAAAWSLAQRQGRRPTRG
jgi:uncharacterized membrane protein YphA (DoxX/SURF4 family)